MQLLISDRTGPAGPAGDGERSAPVQAAAVARRRSAKIRLHIESSGANCKK